MWILLTAVFAGELDCRRCCDAAGVGECETTLRVYGPESKLTRDRGGWRVDGVYVIACDGRGWFDNSRVAYLMSQPVDGQLTMPESEPGAVDCFARACALPRELVLSAAEADGNRRITSTATGLAPDRMAYRRAPAAPGAAAPPAASSPAASASGSPWSPPATAASAGTVVNGSSATVVVLEGQTIYAQRATPSASASPAASAPVEPPARVGPAPSVAPPAVATGSVAAPEGVTPAVASSPATTPSVATPGANPFSAALPPDPPAECYASDGNRASAARAQVLAGDDKRIVGDNTGAVAAYRAAVTLDVCSAYGWLGLGQSALALGRPDIAARALSNATRLMPAHYGAWTELGRAYEGIQQKSLAHAAYEEALSRKPDLVEANAGWRRTAGP